MRFSQPLVLLLGSILSACGVGCSAITAVVSDSRPSNRENRGDADRFAAIGRVFENQGRYDRAEVMYHKALQNRPHDSEVRSQLQQLASRRKEQRFGPGGTTAAAVAAADVVRPPVTGVPQAQSSGAMVRNTLRVSPTAHSATAGQRFGSQQQYQPQPQIRPQRNHPQTLAPTQRPLPAVTPALLKPDADSEAEHAVERRPAPTNSKGWHSSQDGQITSDDILVALEHPDDHVELLLKAMNEGDNFETKALAATLLGDCDPENTQVRNALILHQGLQWDPDVLIALCDSQIERNEADIQTVNCLVCLCTGFDGDTQIEAASELKYFVGTEHEASCLAALNELLASEEPNVRATAALTLGDFSSLDEKAMTRLQNMAQSDPSENVRDAAEAAMNRQDTDSLQVVPPQSVSSN